MVALQRYINKEYQKLLEENSPSWVLKARNDEWQKEFIKGFKDGLNYEGRYKIEMDAVKEYLDKLGIEYNFVGVTAYHNFLVVSISITALQRTQDFMVTSEKKVINALGDVVYKGV
jgi:hypothetical protein